MLLFLVGEMMFFAGLMSTYIVLRLGAEAWRPRGLPPLWRGLSLGNTLLLCVSGISMYLSRRSIRREDPVGLRLYLGITMALGLSFVAIQAYEYQRLMRIVPMAGNLFGSVFYWTGFLHALHVVVGIILLAFVLWRALRGKYHRYRSTGVTVSSLYWYFVVLVWVFLFIALYVL
jgi:cytochrome c oxidase subunit 3